MVDVQRSSVGARAALIKSEVAANGAVAERQLSTVRDAAACPGILAPGRVAADRAATDFHGPSAAEAAPDPSASQRIGAGPVAVDRAVDNGDHPVCNDAAAIDGGRVVGDRAVHDR